MDYIVLNNGVKCPVIGIGTYMLKHILAKDVPVVMTCTLILAAMFYFIILLVDIAYALIDPRIRAQYARKRGV